MHSYELDGRERVAIALAVFSVFLVWLLDMSLNAVGFETRLVAEFAVVRRFLRDSP